MCGTSGLRRVALAFDADEAGETAALAMEGLLKSFGARCERLRPEGSRDWNEWLLSSPADELKDWLVRQLLLA